MVCQKYRLSKQPYFLISPDNLFLNPWEHKKFVYQIPLQIRGNLAIMFAKMLIIQVYIMLNFYKEYCAEFTFKICLHSFLYKMTTTNLKSFHDEQ